MLRVLVHNWWLLALRGAFALAFALLVFFLQAFSRTWLLQAIAFTTVVEFFGLFAISAGFFTIVAGLRGFSKESGWWLVLLDGTAACIAGLAAATLPDLTFLMLVRLIGFWALFVGACELMMARKLRHHLPDEWFLALSRAGSIVFSAYLFFGWAAQVDKIVAWLGFYGSLQLFHHAGVGIAITQATRPGSPGRKTRGFNAHRLTGVTAVTAIKDNKPHT